MLALGEEPVEMRPALADGCAGKVASRPSKRLGMGQSMGQGWIAKPQKRESPELRGFQLAIWR